MLIRGWMKRIDEPDTAVLFETAGECEAGDIYTDSFGIDWIIDFILYDSRKEVQHETKTPAHITQVLQEMFDMVMEELKHEEV